MLPLFRSLTLIVGLFTTALSSFASAEITYTISFDDPGQTNSAWYDRITSHTLAAGADWSSHLEGTAVLDVVVKFSTNTPRASGRSAESFFLRNNGTYDIFEQSAAAEVRTGIDPNGAAPDIEFVFNPDYLANEVWFDPDPYSRTAPIPSPAPNETDAVSVLLHEFGHAFGFNGWRDGVTGMLPGDYASTLDEMTTFDGTNLYFIGQMAMSLYGGPVPLTFGNNFHLGNASPRPGADLIPDLMNGVVFNDSNRYTISQLDLAILRDIGVPLAPAAVPEPSSLLLTSLIAAGAAVLGYRRRRASRFGRGHCGGLSPSQSDGNFAFSD
jgi:hypothetical protein